MLQTEIKNRAKDCINIAIATPSKTCDGTGIWTSPVKWGGGYSVLDFGKFTVDHPVGVGYLLGWYEPEVTKAMNHYVQKGDSVIDAGAHVGYLSVYLSKLVGSLGRVISLEPTPRNREIMLLNIQANNSKNISVLPYALSSSVGEVRFVIDPSSYENRIAEDLREYPSVIQVPCTTLDTVVEDNKVEPSFIKIDIEGSELDALHGSRKTLSRYHPTAVIEVRDSYWSAVRNFMESFHYHYQVLSKPNSSHCQRGTPNVLFTPC